jgi:hypothetical protein
MEAVVVMEAWRRTVPVESKYWKKWLSVLRRQPTSCNASDATTQRHGPASHGGPSRAFQAPLPTAIICYSLAAAAHCSPSTHRREWMDVSSATRAIKSESRHREPLPIFTRAWPTVATIRHCVTSGAHFPMASPPAQLWCCCNLVSSWHVPAASAGSS